MISRASDRQEDKICTYLIDILAAQPGLGCWLTTDERETVTKQVMRGNSEYQTE